MQRKTEKSLKAYELWTWARCRDKILSLKNRLGYGDNLWILGFELHDDGCFFDPIRDELMFNPAKAPKPNLIPFHCSAVPEMYLLLSKYAEASEVTLAGKPVSPGNLDCLTRFRLYEEECGHLLQYAESNFADFKSRSPFLDSVLDFGDFSFSVLPLPKVPVTFALWRGDNEVGNGGRLLFDASVAECLSWMEVELAGLTVWRLRNILDPRVKWGYHPLTSCDNNARVRK